MILAVSISLKSHAHEYWGSVSFRVHTHNGDPYIIYGTALYQGVWLSGHSARKSPGPIMGTMIASSWPDAASNTLPGTQVS